MNGANSKTRFDKVCRTCMNEGALKSLTTLKQESPKAFDLFLKCTAIKLDDKMPQNICPACVSELERFLDFTLRCEKSDSALRRMIDMYSYLEPQVKQEPSKEEEVVIEEQVLVDQDHHEVLKNKEAELIDDELDMIGEEIEIEIEGDEQSDVDDTESDDDEDDSYTSDYHEDDDEVEEEEEEEEEYEPKVDNNRQRMCRKCNTTFDSLDEYREHRTLIHSKPRKLLPPYKCKDCDEVYMNIRQLWQHRKNAKHPKARPRKTECHICHQMFGSNHLNQHMRRHTKDKPYVCNVCGRGFSMSGNLRRHMMIHTGEKPHVCEVCGKGFIQHVALQYHQRQHFPNIANPFKNKRNGPFKRKLLDSGDQSKNEPYVCEICGRIFKLAMRYEAHQRKHFPELFDNGPNPENVQVVEELPREHICEICNKGYKTRYHLKAHQRIHGEKGYLCNECGKGFTTNASLQSHYKVHTGEKPHKCNQCGKAFAHISSFEAHILIHTGQKPHQCHICPKAFKQLSQLKYHLRTHTGERPYCCSYCGKTFALNGNLTVHIRTHTGETPFVCPICGKGFYDSSSMKKHQRLHVKEEKEMLAIIPSA